MADRPGFREWVDRHADPGWRLMPLTHITGAIPAEDIIRLGKIEPAKCSVFDDHLAYFFYGRPAYRVGENETVKFEAACPFCFIFDASLIRKAKFIYAFDTGAFSKRLYKHILLDEMKLEDFSLGTDETRPNRIVSAVFGSMRTYFDGDTTKIVAPEEGAESWEFHARAYLSLIASRGRNEPDDRICSIEVVIGDATPLLGSLKAVVVPHTLWDAKKAPWLEELSRLGVEIKPYLFVPGRHPDYYHAHLETAVLELYQAWKLL